MRRICVIDNSTLVNITKLRHLKIFDNLRSIFGSIHVPLRILQEYSNIHVIDPDRQWVINQLQANYGFISSCTRYDSVALAFLETTKGIDRGEAEAAAQHKVIGSQFVLSDDKHFVRAIKTVDKFVRTLTTLHIIALLYFSKIITDPADLLNELYKHSPFTSRQLKTAYTDIIKELGLNVKKSEIYKMTSFAYLRIP